MKVKAHVLHHIVFALVMIIGNYSKAATGYAGGIPWQTGDIVVCFGTSGCNVLRIVNGQAILLDQFTDNLGGNTYGVAINNSLHVLATDDEGGSKVVVYSVASLNPNTIPATTLAHTPVLYPPDPNPYYDTSVGGGSMVRAVAINNAGNIFVLNSTSGTGNPYIVEIGPGPAQTLVATLSLSSCLGTQDMSLTQATSMDLSAAADANGNSLYAYVTSGGTIQQVTLSTGACTQLANFGPNVTLYGIKDIPPRALANVSPNCNGTPCPTDETILVVATGVIDPGGVSVDICTDQVISPPVTDSCGLLIDTNPNDQRLTAPLWSSGTLYPTLGAMILDPYADLEEVLTAGTSGATKPPFSAKGGTVIDNAVIWTNQGRPGWNANTAYASAPPLPTTGTYIVDTNNNLQTVSTAGTSGPTQPTWALSGNTVDGLVWQEQFGPVTGYSIDASLYGTTPANLYVVDTSSFVWEALQAGTSGTGCCNDVKMLNTPDNSVTWTDQGQQYWHPSFAFSQGAIIVDPNSHVQKVTTVGTSGASLPAFSQSGGTISDGLIWTDQGTPGSWTASASPAVNAVILDSNGHVQEVVAAAGPSGSTTPSFNTAGGLTIDGSVVWQDRGIPGAWAAVTFYALNTVILDSETPSPHVQQATSAGTSGLTAPTSFTSGSTAGNMVNDNAVMWTDEGGLGASIPAGFRWAASTAYPNNTSAEIVDTASPPHVQLASATVTGPSGISGTPKPPKFVDGGTVNDGTVTWMDEGQQFWRANTPFLALSIILDGKNHVQQATTPGTSGPVQPKFVDGSSPGVQVSDGLVWTDQGTPGSWTASASPAVNAVILDSNGHVQEVVAAAGPSGSTTPSFNTAGGLTIDGSVVWQDRGIPGAWAAVTFYALNTVILDSETPSPHVQQATSAGTSGLTAPASFTSGSTVGATVPDNAVVWTDQGQVGSNTAFSWQMNTNYTPGYMIVDAAYHVQEATQASTGMSSSAPPKFVDGGTVIDGLIWTFVTGPVVPYPPAAPVAVGTQIIDPNLKLQKAIEAGTPKPLTTGAQWQISGTTIDDAVIWTESHPGWAPGTYTVGNAGTLILDTNNNVELVTNNNLANKVNSSSGITGPSQPSAGGRNAWNMTTGGYTIDGLQWTTTLVSPDTSVIARYPVGVTTLQSLALDPLIVDCTAGCNYPLPPLQVSSVITSPGSTNPTFLSSPGFWLGDKQYPNFYKLDFATGTPTQFSANGPINTGGTPCSTCEPEGGIQGLGIYASEGANQPGLAKLLPPSNNLTGNSQIGYFPSSTANTKYVQNSLQQTLLTGSTVASSMGPFALYASPVAPGSCFDDSTGNPPCLATFQPGLNAPGAIAFPIMWKSDIPLPSSGNLVVSSTQVVTENFDFPMNFQSFSNDVQLDSLLDVTTLVGVDRPGGTSKSSTLHGYQLKSGNGKAENNYGCTYLSPLSPSCFANPGTIPIKFSCSNLQGNSLASYGVTKTTPWGPNMQVLEFPNAPIPIPQGFNPASSLCKGTANTGSAPNQANAGRNASNLVPTACTASQLPSSNGANTASLNGGHWQYNWAVQSTSKGVVYQVCTYDDSTGSWSSTGQKGAPFCSGFFYVKNSCP